MSQNFPHDDELLTSLFDGELSGEQRAAAEQLLAGNPEHQAQFEAWQKMGDRLRRLPRYQLQSDVSGKVLDEIAKRQSSVANSVVSSASVVDAANSGGASAKLNWRGGAAAIASLAALLLATLFVFPNLVQNASDQARVAQSNEAPANERLEIGKDAALRDAAASRNAAGSFKAAAAATQEAQDTTESGEELVGVERESLSMEKKSAGGGGGGAPAAAMFQESKLQENFEKGAERKSGQPAEVAVESTPLEGLGVPGEQSRMPSGVMAPGRELATKPSSDLADDLADESLPTLSPDRGGFAPEMKQLASDADQQRPLRFAAPAMPPATTELAAVAESFSASAADEAAAVPPLQQILWIDVDAEVLLAGENEESTLPALAMVTKALQRNSISMVADSAPASPFDQNDFYRDAPDKDFRNDASQSRAQSPAQSPAEQGSLESLDGKATPETQEKSPSARAKSAQLQSLKSTVLASSPAGVEAITVVATVEQMKQAVIEISNNARVSGFEIPRQQFAARRLQSYPLSNSSFDSLQEPGSEAMQRGEVAPADSLKEEAEANQKQKGQGKDSAKESDKNQSNDQSSVEGKQPQPDSLVPAAPESQEPEFESKPAQTRNRESVRSEKPSLARQSELEAIDRWFDNSNLDARVGGRVNDTGIPRDSVSPPAPTAPPQVQYLLLIRTPAANR